MQTISLVLFLPPYFRVLVYPARLRDQPNGHRSCLGQLPYGQSTTDSGTELDVLEVDSDVLALRNLHRADLVMLIGYFPATCGRG